MLCDIIYKAYERGISMKISKKLIVLLLSCGITINIGGCSSKEVDVDLSLDETVDLNSDNTLLDSIDDKVTLDDEEVSIVSASDMLEEKINIYKTLNLVDLSLYDNLKPLDVISIEEVENLSLEEVNEYISILNSEEEDFNSNLEKGRIAQKLLYLKNYLSEFLKDNTYGILENVLLTTIKTSVANTIGVDDYDNIKIEPLTDEMKYTLTYYDKISGNTIPLYVEAGEGFLYKDIDTLYNLQSKEEESLDYDDVLVVIDQNKCLVAENLKEVDSSFISKDSEESVVKRLQK